MNWWATVLIIACILSVLFSLITGLECECTTYECLSEGRTSCTASHSCYSQLTKVVERGCIDRKTPLLCENQRPNKKTISSKLIAGWPVLHCCRDRNYCNRGVIPTEPPGRKDSFQNEEEQSDGYYDDLPKETVTEKPNCPQSVADSGNASGSATINPIYIAVPVAGLCVLLALIIFAMYLLRRRGDYYERYPYPQTMTVPRHHIQCKDTKCVPSCKLNRCTDSERSSSGSETKLFL